MKAALAGAAVLGAALGLAAPAAAQETTADAPFSGIYIGGSFGYDVQPNDVGETIEFDRNLDGVFTDTISTATVTDAFSPGFCNGRATNNVAPSRGGPRCRNDKDGIAYYGRVGADIQRGNIVFGVVGEFGKSEISDSVSAFSTTPAFYTMTRDLKWEASARVRAGYAANTTLFYGTAGGGYANIDNSFTTGNTANTFTSNGDSKQWASSAAAASSRSSARTSRSVSNICSTGTRTPITAFAHRVGRPADRSRAATHRAPTSVATSIISAGTACAPRPRSGFEAQGGLRQAGAGLAQARPARQGRDRRHGLCPWLADIEKAAPHTGTRPLLYLDRCITHLVRMTGLQDCAAAKPRRRSRRCRAGRAWASPLPAWQRPPCALPRPRPAER